MSSGVKAGEKHPRREQVRSQNAEGPMNEANQVKRDMVDIRGAPPLIRAGHCVTCGLAEAIAIRVTPIC